MSCWTLGIQRGLSDEQATAYFTEACDLGSWDGCNALAEAFEEGTGITADRNASARALSRAIELAQVACTKEDDARACGILLEEGVMRGGALDALRASCERGYRIACFTLGVELEKSDATAAAKAYERGCVRGNGFSVSCAQLDELKTKRK